MTRQPTSRKRTRALVITIIVLLGAAWIGWALWGGNSTSGGKGRKQQTPVVSVAPAVRKDIPVYLDGLGTIQAYNTVTVHTQVDGQLVEIAFREGQDVKKGQVLAKIDPRTFQAQYDQAVAAKARDEAQLENARRDLQRYVNLGDTVSGQTVDTQRATVKQLEATVKSGQAAIDSARTELGYATITAPIPGRTGMRQVDVGNIVHPGDVNGIVVLTQLEPISVVFSLPQQDVPKVNAGMMGRGKLKVLAVGADNQEIIDTGALELMDNQIDQATGTVKLKATFPNAKRLLWPGGFANIRLLLEMRKSSLTVPAVAVQRGPDGSHVFVLKGEDKVEMRAVKPAMMEGRDAVIEEGLADGEQVVTDGATKLEDGAKVQLAGQGAAADKPSQPGAKKNTEGHKKDKKHRQTEEKPSPSGRE